jgi:hypothetical protein
MVPPIYTFVEQDIFFEVDEDDIIETLRKWRQKSWMIVSHFYAFIYSKQSVMDFERIKMPKRGGELGFSKN